MTAPPFETSVGDPTLASAVEPLRRTAPWVRFIAILNFLLVGLMLLVAIPMLVLDLGRLAPGVTGGGAAMKLLGLMYICMAALYALPAFLSWRYATAISHFMQVVTAPQLAVALNAQRRVWKFWGILLAIGLAFSLVGIGVAMFAGVAGLMGGGGLPGG